MSDLHSVKADLHPEPSDMEDAADLAMYQLELRAVQQEVADHRLISGYAAHNGLAARASWHEHQARLARQQADLSDRCAVILRRMAGRVDELRARRLAPIEEASDG